MRFKLSILLSLDTLQVLTRFKLSILLSLDTLQVLMWFKLSILLSLDTLQVLGAKTEKNMEGQWLGAFQNLQTMEEETHWEYIV
jgi:hypothetical protein